MKERRRKRMREIKFRIRFGNGKKVKTIIYPLNNILQGQVKEFLDLNSDYKILSTDEFTGLKDKNKKEIYEGDILAGEAVEMMPDWSDMDADDKEAYNNRKPNIKNSEVYWSENEEFGRWDLSPEIHLETAEVIGNIYENPELLKEGKNDNNNS